MALLGLGLLAGGCGDASRHANLVGQTMGTSWNVQIVASDVARDSASCGPLP